MESGTSNISIQTVVGYKFEDGQEVPLPSGEASEENVHQGGEDTNFNVPEDGRGYYLVFKDSTTHAFRYDNDRVYKFKELTEDVAGEDPAISGVISRAYLPNTISINTSESMEIWQYGYDSSAGKTINRPLEITSFTPASAGPAVESNTEFLVGSNGTYQVWFDYKNMSVGFETDSVSASPESLVETVNESEQKPAMMQTGDDKNSVRFAGKTTGQGPKKAEHDDSAYYLVGSGSFVNGTEWDTSGGVRMRAATGNNAGALYGMYLQKDDVFKITNGTNWYGYNSGLSSTYFAHTSYTKSDKSKAEMGVDASSCSWWGNDSSKTRINLWGGAAGHGLSNHDLSGTNGSVTIFTDNTTVKFERSAYSGNNTGNQSLPSNWSTQNTFFINSGGNGGSWGWSDSYGSNIQVKTSGYYNIYFDSSAKKVVVDSVSMPVLRGMINNSRNGASQTDYWSSNDLVFTRNASTGYLTYTTILHEGDEVKVFATKNGTNKWVGYHENLSTDYFSGDGGNQTVSQRGDNIHILKTGTYTFALWREIFEYDNLEYVFQSSSKSKITFAALDTSITLNRQSGTGGDGSVTATYESAMPTITVPTRSGYTFGGYFTGTGGTGDQYYKADGTSNKNWDLEDESKTLFAKWTADTYTIEFNANGGSGTTASVTATYGATRSLTDNGFTRTGYTFAGWATSSDGAVVHANSATLTSSQVNTYYGDVGKGGTKTLYAKWNIITYTVTADNNSGSGANDKTYSISGSNQTVALDTPTRTGYTFDGYTVTTQPTNGGATISSKTTLNIPAGSYGPITVQAQWTVHTHTLTWNFNGGTPSGSYTAAGSVNYGATIDYPDSMSKDGYTFAGWSSEPSNMPDNNLTLTASWTANTYRVALDRQGGTSSGSTYVDATYNSAMPSATAPSGKTGWTFGGYYSGEGGTGDCYYNASMVSQRNWTTAGTGTLYAKWTANITLNVNGGDGDNGSISGVVWNKAYSDLGSTPTRAGGYVFLGYYTEAEGGTQVFNNLGKAAQSKWLYGTTLFAHWQQCYVINFSGGDGATGEVSPAYGTYGGTATTAAMGFTKAGYHVVAGSEWKTSDGLSVYAANTAYSFGLASGASITLYANWVGNSYEVEFDGNGSTSGSMSNETGFVYGTGKALTANGFTRTGYEFAGWNTAANGSGSSYAGGTTLTTPTPTPLHNGTLTLYAQWTPTTYTISYTLNGGTASNRTEYNIETATFTLSNPTKTGYTFAGWTGSNGESPQTTVTISVGSTGNKSYTANWTADTYTIEFDANGGSGTTASVTATFGSTRSLTANGFTRTGYTFAGWATSAVGPVVHANNATLTVEQVNTYYGNVGKGETKTLYAIWTAKQATLSFNMHGGSPTPTASGKATYDDEMPTLTSFSVPTKTGYSFTGFFDAESGGNQYYDATGASACDWNKDTTETVVLHAQWSANGYTVTLNKQSGTGGDNSVTATYDADMPAIAVPTRTGYTFNGYFDNTSGGTKYYNANGTSAKAWDKATNSNLYAQWTARTYTVYESHTNAGTVEVDSTGSFGSALSISWEPENATGYNYTNLNVKIYANNAASGTVLATWTSGTSNSFTMSGTYYANICIAVTYTKTAKTYTVTLDKQSGAGGSDSVTATYAAAMPSASMPSRTGYTFGGYYTEANGQGTQYYTNVGASARPWDIDDDTTLYAKWTPITYYVHFDGNDETGGEMSDQEFTYDQALTALTSNAFSKTGYTFGGWSLSAGGEREYTNGQTVRNLMSTAGTYTVYARWTKTVTLDKQNGTGGSNTIDVVWKASVPSSVTAPTRTGYSFGGYYTGTNGTGTQVYNGGTGTVSYITTNSANIWAYSGLYAKWTANSYRITYDTNGGNSLSYTTYTFSESQQTKTLTAATRTGYRFNSYTVTSGPTSSTTPTFSGLVMTLPASTYGNITVTASWDANTYTVTFYKNQNAATGTMAVQNFTYGEAQNLTSIGFTWRNHSFVKWTRNANGTGDYYTNAQEVINLTSTHGGNIDLYAQWEVTAGLYLMGRGIYYTENDVSSAWTLDQALLEDEPGAATSTWTTVRFNSGAGFLIVQIDNAGTVTDYVHVNGTPDVGISGGGNWKDAPDFSCSAGGTYNVTYAYGDSLATFAQVIRVTLYTNEGSVISPDYVGIVTGSAMPALSAGQIPTRSGHAFGGYWTVTKDGSGNITSYNTKYYYPDGTSAANAASFTELYARWYSTSNVFVGGDTYHLVPSDQWLADGAYFKIKLTGGPSADAYVVMSSTDGIVYNGTLPANGCWANLEFHRSADNTEAEGTCWNYTGSKTKSGSTSYYFMAGDATGNNIGSWISNPQAFVSGEWLFLKPNAAWKEDGAIYGVYLYGNSDPIMLELDSVALTEGGITSFAKIQLPQVAGVNQSWYFVIFLRVNPNFSGHLRWNASPEEDPKPIWNKTANLYRTNGTTENMWDLTNGSGAWNFLDTSLVDGWYIIGGPGDSSSIFYGHSWTAIAGNIGADDDTHEAVWTSLSLRASDEFKFVYVHEYAPDWSGAKGYYAANVGSVLVTGSGGSNYGVTKNMIVDAYIDSSYNAHVVVKSYSESIAIKGYSSTLSTGTPTYTAGNVSATVSVSSDGKVSGITGENATITPDTFTYDFKRYSTGTAYNSDAYTPNALNAGTTFYAIYWKQTATVLVKAIYTSGNDETAFAVATITVDKGVTLNNYSSSFPIAYTDASKYMLRYCSNEQGAMYAFRATEGSNALADSTAVIYRTYSNGTYSNSVTLASASVSTDEQVYYIKTAQKNATVLYIDASWSANTASMLDNTKFEQIHITLTDGTELFYSNSDSAWRVAKDLYRITMPEDFEFRVSKGVGGELSGSNYTVAIDTGSAKNVAPHLAFITAYENYNHPVYWVKPVPTPASVGTATVTVTGQTPKVMTQSDLNPNYFIYELGQKVNAGDQITVSMTLTGEDPISPNYLTGLPWFVNRGVNTDRVAYYIKGEGNFVPDTTKRWTTDAGIQFNADPNEAYDAVAYGIYFAAGDTFVVDTPSTTFHYSNVVSGSQSYVADVGANHNIQIRASGTYNVFIRDSGGNTDIVIEESSAADCYLYAADDVSMNYYIYRYNNNFYVSIAGVPEQGNGYYIMNYAENGGSTNGFKGGVKMVSASGGEIASYSHFHAEQNDVIYVGSYLNGVAEVVDVTSQSKQTPDGYTTMNDNDTLTINTTGFYTLKVINLGNGNKRVMIYSYDASRFFTLGGTSVVGAASLEDQKTALILEVKFTIESNDDMVISVTTDSNPYIYSGNYFAHFALYVVDEDGRNGVGGLTDSGIYDTVLEEVYDAGVWGTTSVANCNSDTARISPTSESLYAYIVIDYVAGATIDLAAAASDIQFKLWASQYQAA